ncbi:uncharacterized protein BP01DRAFT_381142 [Aspergillus saccharolyticus JOP 1030-1]|uniref:Zn(II)2Cys6 transcription factor n=1 Tax=Aspergillus saccharolyticus JOP 1030-1 TaxID=1450539 RepID=A0A318ZRY8_9EURO|nr:hypothetical protein BP01DRAFT_381142 [Aspergillus saccharolyticus JOP 1030-1]PYH46710.1 hypothetical protein BP01DRAFT_381142 [Aspergillus saccharolyticus JOP 1030-1]
MVGKPSFTGEAALQPLAHVHLVNFSSFDMNLHHHLTGPESYHAAQLTLRSPMPFNPSHLDIAENDLLQYFRCIASRSLTTFTHDPVDLGNIILQLTLLNDSPSATAVLRALLALSSVHRDGLQSQAAGLKISALKALIAAPKHDITAIEAAQHVAAGMLLCSFEIHRASCTSGQWMTYLLGAKRIIQASSLESSGEFGPLIDWVYYHDVLSRFSNLHWHSKIANPDSPSSETSAETFSLLSPGMPSVEQTTLTLLSDICDAISTLSPEMMPPTDDDRDDHHTFLKTLVFRIRTISSAEIPPPGHSRRRTMTALFQCAMLVYLHRAASMDLLELAAETERRLHNAFATLAQLDACERQFPLFILGCEARSDHERSIVLDLITRTQEHAASRSLYLVRRMIEAIWIQDDLAKGPVNYTEKLSAVLSCCAILPTFV